MRQHIQIIYFFVLVFSSTSVVPSSSYAKEKTKTVSSASSSNALLAELTGRDPSKATELELYSEFVKSYRANDQVRIRNQSDSFIKRFPNSNFADNILFLVGKHHLENRNYAEAIRSFQRVIDLYPNSNKSVSARFAKAMTYEKMHLPEQAKLVFLEVRSQFPGSPESFRADNQLKLMDGVIK